MNCIANNLLNTYLMIWQRKEQVAGAYSGEAQHMLGPENPLKSIDFTGPWGGSAPIAPP